MKVMHVPHVVILIVVSKQRYYAIVLLPALLPGQPQVRTFYSSRDKYAPRKASHRIYRDHPDTDFYMLLPGWLSQARLITWQ